MCGDGSIDKNAIDSAIKWIDIFAHFALCIPLARYAFQFFLLLCQFFRTVLKQFSSTPKLNYLCSAQNLLGRNTFRIYQLLIKNVGANQCETGCILCDSSSDSLKITQQKPNRKHAHLSCWLHCEHIRHHYRHRCRSSKSFVHLWNNLFILVSMEFPKIFNSNSMEWPDAQYAIQGCAECNAMWYLEVALCILRNAHFPLPSCLSFSLSLAIARAANQRKAHGKSASA